MLRYLFVFAFMFLISSFGLTLEELYLQKGIKAVEKKIEKNLQDTKFWSNVVSKRDVSLGYYEQDITLISVSKKDKVMHVYDYQEGKLLKKLTQNVILGKEGAKEKEGDLKTPIGVYNLTKRFEPRDPFYGPLAFSLSYPNLMDKLQGKNGYGIWIHGSPLDGVERDLLSRGCVVLSNDLLVEFDSVVGNNFDRKKVITVISEYDSPVVSKDEIGALLANLYQWKNSWKVSDLDAYLKFYHKDFKRFDGMGIKRFSEMKRSIFSKKEEKEIIFSNIQIAPYPNIDGKKLFKISFYENYKTARYKFNGNKDLYVKLQNGQMKIIAER